MAIYRDADAVVQSRIHSAAYDERYKGGQDDVHARQAPSGIYRCACGVEIVHVLHDRFPPTHDERMENHAVLWALKVLPHHEGDALGSGEMLQRLRVTRES